MSGRLAEHVAAFNAAVRSGDWDAFVARFALDARVEFVPGPTFSGRDAIALAYASQPPDDTMTVLSVLTDGATDVARFSWDAGGTGTMRMTWAPNGCVATLVVAFD